MANQKNTPVRIDLAEANANLPSTEYRESILDSTEETIHLRDYIEVVMRRKWLIISILFFIFISTLIFSLVAKKLYMASGTIEVSTEAQKVTKFEDVVNEQMLAQDFISTQEALLKSNTLAERVIDDLNLKNHPALVKDDEEAEPSLTDRFKQYIKSFVQRDENQTFGNLSMEEALKDNKILKFFKENLKVSPRRNSMIIDVSFTSPDRQLSQKVVNHLMEEYVNWKMDQKVESSGKAREYLMKQIDRTKINLEQAEEQQHKFARQAGIVSMDSRLNSVYQQLEDVNTALGEAEVDLIKKKTRYEQALEDGPESLPEVLNSLLINNLKSEYAQLRSEYENLVETFHEGYPEVKKLKSRMESIEDRIASESWKIFESIKHDYLVANNRFESLKQKMEQNKEQALELNERSTQYTIMAREVGTNKAIYQSLLERAKEIESMAGVSPSNVQIVDKASLPLFPDKPKVRRNLLLAIVLGLTGGIGMAFLVEYFADTITNPDQISERFQIPILGVLPLEKESPDYPVELIFVNDPQSAMSEALRTTKVSIQLSGSGSNAKCMVITSSSRSEGKTTIAANMAQTFAGAGERILLIDADLRKPRLHKIFPEALTKNNGNGLSNYLAGVVNHEVIAQTSIDNLCLIPAGPIPPNPVELLASNRFSQLLKKSGETFDRIIIDSPPHHGFADILVLSRQAGGMILVSSIGETTRDGLRHFKKAMSNVQGTVLGCIVNKVNLHQRYGYHSYYKYYRAYNYQYGKSHERKKEKRLEG